MKRIIMFTLLSALPMVAAAFDPVAAVQQHLNDIKRDPPMTYRTNGDVVICTAHCRDQAEWNALYDSFRRLPNAGVSGTSKPSAVSVIVPMNPPGFQQKQEARRQEAALQKAAEQEQAAQALTAAEAKKSIADRMQERPEDFYGQDITFIGEYEGLDHLPGDFRYELGFAVRENGKRVSCVVFTEHITGDPITQYVPVRMGAAVRSLGMNSKVKINGKLVSPEPNAVHHMRRSRPFFVVRNIERI